MSVWRAGQLLSPAWREWFTHGAVLARAPLMLPCLSTFALALATAVTPLVSQALNSLTNFLYIYIKDILS